MNFNDHFFDYSYETDVKKTFIIRLKGNEISETLSKRCLETCKRVGQVEPSFFSAIDGTKEELFIPEESFHPLLKLLKLTNKSLTLSEVGCLLSHFLLWVKCVEEDAPFVILEHDAVMIRPYLSHPFFNIISYLGSREQVNGTLSPQFPLPPHGQLNENFRFILRAHAYAIDPMVARSMISKIIKLGIYTSADILMRADEFGIIQDGIYAYDLPGEETTILFRDSEEHKKEFKLINMMLCQ